MSDVTSAPPPLNEPLRSNNVLLANAQPPSPDTLVAGGRWESATVPSQTVAVALAAAPVAAPAEAADSTASATATPTEPTIAPNAKVVVPPGGVSPTMVAPSVTEAGSGASGSDEFIPRGPRDWTPGGTGEPARPPVPNESLASLHARSISAWFGQRKVLDRVSLDMSAGVITSLIGPSGCGKSTFLRILNRMHELIPGASLAGEVLLDGHDIYDPARRLTQARRDIGMVFQKPNPFPAMSIYDNVLSGLRLTGAKASRSEKDDLVESSLIKAGLWKEVRDRLRQPGGGLSGGQQQRLCIARSIAIQPRVLLMDEPCSALDPTSTRVIEETMLDLAREVTIVIVTHNMQQAQRVSTQCAFFLAAQGQPGGIVESGATDRIFSSPVDTRTADYVNGRFG